MPLEESQHTEEQSDVTPDIQNEFVKALTISRDIRSKIQSETEFNEKIAPHLENWTLMFRENATPKLILECPIGATYFRKFLETEMNTENLTAYLDFKAFYEMLDREGLEWSKVKDEIQKLSKTYVENGATSEINLPSKVKSVWIEHIEAAAKISSEDDILQWKNVVKEDLYERMRNELNSNLMDPYSRFIQHHLFQEIVRFVFSGKFEQMRDKITSAGKKDIYVLNSIIEWDKDLNVGEPLTLISNLLTEFMGIFKNPKIWNEDGSINYETIQADQSTCHWGKLNQKTCQLQTADVGKLSESERKAFFINLYNLMMIHGVLTVNGDVGTVFDRSIFAKQIHYNVGGQLYSLESLLQTLRTNPKDCVVCTFFKKSLGKKEMKQLTKFPKDVSILFSLIDLTNSSPSLSILDGRNVEETLNKRTAWYISEHVKVKDEERSIHVPPLLTDFYKDFKVAKASHDDSIKLFLSKYIKFPFEYKLVRTDQSYDVDYRAMKLTEKCRTNTVCMKKGEMKNQTKTTLKDITTPAQFESWLNAIDESGIQKTVKYWLTTYQGAFVSSELVSWLENNKEAGVSRKEALVFLNKMLEKNVFYILTCQGEIVDDSKQYLQLQKSLIPIGFGKVLAAGILQKPGKLTSSKRFVVLYEEGMAIFTSQRRLLEALLFVSTIKYFVSSGTDGVSFAMTIPPYFSMTLQCSKKDERKIWMDQFSSLKYFDVKEEVLLSKKSTFANFRKYFI